MRDSHHMTALRVVLWFGLRDVDARSDALGVIRLRDDALFTAGHRQALRDVDAQPVIDPWNALHVVHGMELLRDVDQDPLPVVQRRDCGVLGVGGMMCAMPNGAWFQSLICGMRWVSFKEGSCCATLIVWTRRGSCWMAIWPSFANAL